MQGLLKNKVGDDLFSLFIDKATVKTGEISYFGKHSKVVTIFYIPNLLTLCNIDSYC